MDAVEAFFEFLRDMYWNWRMSISQLMMSDFSPTGDWITDVILLLAAFIIVFLIVLWWKYR